VCIFDHRMLRRPIRMENFRELRENLLVNCENVMTEILQIFLSSSSVSCIGEQSRIGTGTQTEATSQALSFGEV